MRNSLYSKLAVKNIISNRRIFVPYMLMSIIFIAMFFMLLNLSVQLERSIGKVALSFEPLFVICLTVTALISLIILLYTNGFLIKYRTRELGLYSILGLEKNAIIKVVSLETLFIATITIICGLLGGMVFAKLFYLIITKLINVKSPIGFYIAKDALVKTAALFFLIYLLSILKNYIKLIRLKPLDILREQEKGEKEPKFKFFGTILGLGFIGYGYYLAHNTESYVSSIINFVFAVILVVLGTYLLFINVSIAVLKFLKSRKGFYYKSKNFLSVSNLIYRMKHNAAGLASICILSTMTLVAISTSLSLYASVEEALHKRHPYMFTSTFYEHDKKFNLNTVKKELEQAESDYNIKVTEYNHYKVDYRVSQFVDNKFFMAKNDNIFDFSNKVESQYLLLDDYNAINGTSLQLNDDELFVKTSINLGDTINFVGENGKEQQFNLIKLDNAQLSFINTESIIYKDNLIFILKNEKIFNNLTNTPLDLIFQFNFDGKSDDIMNFSKNFKLSNAINTNRQTDRVDFYMVYGIFFFIGIYLGLIFLVATVLVIYYKQITEGMQDRDRFQLLKKIGIEDKQVKAIINKQVLIVFFSPLVVAFIHLIAAYKNITDILTLLNGVSPMLFMKVTLVLCLIYSLAYMVVYKLTSTRYYKIVNLK